MNLEQLNNMTAEEILDFAAEYQDQEDMQDNVMLEIFKKAAAKGSPQAAWSVGKMYETGQGTEVDYAQAKEYYERSDQAGFGHAPGSLGNLYFEGNGVEKDLEKAFQLYKKGAAMGSMEAGCNLGLSLYYGYGTKQDKDQGFDILNRVYENGYQQASVYLDRIMDELYEESMNKMTVDELMENGEALTKPTHYNPGMSFRCYKKAADQGNAEAMYITANNYNQGNGTDIDYEAAAAYYLKAAQNGHAEAKALWKELTGEEI